MNNELIKRIEAEQGMFPSTSTLEGVLIDCKAEILRLEKAREYVPLSLAEWRVVWANKNGSATLLEHAESEVIKRAGLIVKEK